MQCWEYFIRWFAAKSTVVLGMLTLEKVSTKSPITIHMSSAYVKNFNCGATSARDDLMSGNGRASMVEQSRQKSVEGQIR